jgi:cytoskeleton protein RodZ
MTSETSSLGEFLRHERERRGITIEQVASATKIGVRTLHSLESDHYAELPAKPFIRGFVIAYCRFIGLDAKEVLGNYTDFMTLKATERPNREGGHSGYAFEKRDGEQQSRTLLFFAIFGFVLIGGVAVLLLKPSFHHRKNSHIDKLRAAHSQDAQDVTVEGQPNPGPSSSPLATTGTGSAKEAETAASSSLVQPVTASAALSNSVAAPLTVPSSLPSVTLPVAADATPAEKVASSAEPEKPGADPEDPLDSGHKLRPEEAKHKVLFKIKEDLWVRYQVDNRPARKFIIRGGKTLMLRGADKIVFQVSSPELISYSYNNHGLAQLSDGGKNAIKIHGETTLFFPLEAKAGSAPFKDTRPLPKVVSAKPEATQPESSPTPQQD